MTEGLASARLRWVTDGGPAGIAIVDAEPAAVDAARRDRTMVSNGSPPTA